MPELPEERPAVLHVITGLGTGGAEVMLCKVLQETRGELRSGVVSLMDRGPLADTIEALGVPVSFAGMGRGTLPTPAVVRNIVLAAKRFAPTHIQGWMYHGNLAASLMAGLVQPRPRLIWNVRQTLYSLRNESRLTAALIRISSLLSRHPDTIIYNSRLSADQHERIGFFPGRRTVIPNGFDLEIFRPDPQARDRMRRELGLRPASIVIGQIARLHPMKGHFVMLKAGARIVERTANAQLLFAGAGMSSDNPELMSALDRFGLRGKVHLLGERSDVSSLLQAIDIAVLPSLWGDAFPNAIGEAMAAGVPCVVSDIGDAGTLVGNCGRVVPPGDVVALSDAICELIDAGPDVLARLAEASRRRIAEHFSLPAIGLQYRQLYVGG